MMIGTQQKQMKQEEMLKITKEKWKIMKNDNLISGINDSLVDLGWRNWQHNSLATVLDSKNNNNNYD